MFQQNERDACRFILFYLLRLKILLFFLALFDPFFIFTLELSYYFLQNIFDIFIGVYNILYSTNFYIYNFFKLFRIIYVYLFVTFFSKSIFISLRVCLYILQIIHYNLWFRVTGQYITL